MEEKGRPELADLGAVVGFQAHGIEAAGARTLCCSVRSHRARIYIRMGGGSQGPLLLAVILSAAKPALSKVEGNLAAAS